MRPFCKLLWRRKNTVFPQNRVKILVSSNWDAMRALSLPYP